MPFAESDKTMIQSTIVDLDSSLREACRIKTRLRISARTKYERKSAPS